LILQKDLLDSATLFFRSEMMNLYVGNLSFETTEKDLEQAFSAFGQVSTVSIVKDRETGRSRGFAFVEMPDRKAAMEAINGLNLQQIAGRSVTVNEARPKTNSNRRESRRY
jgi:RNA recognition motif-containing protein